MFDLEGVTLWTLGKSVSTELWMVGHGKSAVGVLQLGESQTDEQGQRTKGRGMTECRQGGGGMAKGWRSEGDV